MEQFEWPQVGQFEWPPGADRDKLFYEQYPELAPQVLGLRDERHMLGGDDGDHEPGEASGHAA